MAFQMIVMTAMLLLSGCQAHWKLTKPVPRSGNLYENNPLPPDANTKEDWVCRNPSPNPNVEPPILVAGSTTTVVYGGGATVGHAGDCSVYISYDTGRARRTMRWVKIANLPDCRAQINQDVPIRVPAVLPPGNAVLRWDQYALHQGSFVEWFIQCADIKIQSSSTQSWDRFNTFSMIDNNGVPAYPSGVSNYRSPYDPNQDAPGKPDFFMTGPACVDNSINQCVLTAVGTKGYSGFGGEGPRGSSSSTSLYSTPTSSTGGYDTTEDPSSTSTSTGAYGTTEGPSPGEPQCCYDAGCPSYGTIYCNAAGSWCSASQSNCQSCGGTLCTGIDDTPVTPPPASYTTTTSTEAVQCIPALTCPSDASWCDSSGLSLWCAARMGSCPAPWCQEEMAMLQSPRKHLRQAHLGNTLLQTNATSVKTRLEGDEL